MRRTDRLPGAQAAALARTAALATRDVGVCVLSEAPPGQVDFALYPWIVSNEKLKRTLGWTPAHSSRETFEITMRKQGKMAPAEAAEARPAGARVAA